MRGCIGNCERRCRCEPVLREHRQVVQIVAPANEIARDPTESLAKANHDPGGVLVAAYRLHEIAVVKLPQAQIGAARPGANVGALGVNDSHPVAHWRFSWKEGARGRAARDGRWGQIGDIQHRQRINVLNPLSEVAANPAVAVAIANQHPIARRVAAERDEVIAFDQPSHRAIISTGATANEDIGSNDDTATRSWLGRGRLRRSLRCNQRNRQQAQHNGEHQPAIQTVPLPSIDAAVY